MNENPVSRIIFQLQNRTLSPDMVNAGIVGDNLSVMLVFNISSRWDGLQKRIKFSHIEEGTFFAGNEFLVPIEITKLKTVQIQLEFFGLDGKFIANSTISTLNFGEGIIADSEFVPPDKVNEFIRLRGLAFASAKNELDEIVFYNIDGLEIGRVKGGTGGGAPLVIDETTLKYTNGKLSVNTTDTMAKDNAQPITSHGVALQVGNINALLEQI